LLTVVILTVDVAAGLWSGSLALLSDAGHVLTDLAALGLAWFAVAQGRRPPDQSRTFGYHRASILAALANSAALVLVVLWILFEAGRRLVHPGPVQGGLVMAAAALTLAVNAYIGLRLREAGHDLNVQAVLLHVAGDVLASAGVLVAGAVILLSGWAYADPLVSVGIAALIAFGALRLGRETVHVLLEGTPRGTSLAEVSEAILAVPGVDSVHDLHVWELARGQLALSCHLVVAELPLADAEHMMRKVESCLCDRFGIGHTTIQVESCHPCLEDGLGHGAGQHNHPHASWEPLADDAVPPR
jgi:cobalt-zinc-cadmium efflux system protein